MLSKIENGVAAPSLGTLAALAGALRLPVTAFFRHVEAARDAIFAPAGQGLALRGRGSRAGPRYRLLGHAPGRRIAVEPYMITLRPSADLFPPFQHAGVEFLYMLEGELGYRHGERIYRMRPGDALSFDADVPHGPVALTRLPIRFLSVICYASDGGDSGGLSPPGANARLTRSRIRPGA
jgi:transcriptional regulator with XRE-family HTH domain